MKNYFALLVLVSTIQISFAQIQCSDLGMSVSTGSQPGYVQLYHSGMYLVWPRTANVIEWEISDFQGNIVHRDTLRGNTSAGQSGTMLFYHNVPITDSMKVSTLLYNDTAVMACLVEDTLFWKEKEVTPGVFTYSWKFLSGNTGTSVLSVSRSQIDNSRFRVFPSPASNDLYIEGPEELYSLTILNISGQVVYSKNDFNGNQKIDVSNLTAGHYIINVSSDKRLETLRFVKQ